MKQGYVPCFTERCVMAGRKQYPLRIDPEVWAAVERWAADEMRSANAQVEWILRDELRRAGRLPGQGGTSVSNTGLDDDAADDASADGEPRP